MLGLRREVLEYIVIGVTSFRIANALWTASRIGMSHLPTNVLRKTQRRSSHLSFCPGWELLGFSAVTIVAIAQEVLSVQHRAGITDVCFILTPVGGLRS